MNLFTFIITHSALQVHSMNIISEMGILPNLCIVFSVFLLPILMCIADDTKPNWDYFYDAMHKMQEKIFDIMF